MRGRRVKGVHIAVRIKPDDAGIDTGPLRPGQRGHRDQTVAGHYGRRATVSDGRGDLVRSSVVERGQPVPDVALGQLQSQHPDVAGQRQRDNPLAQPFVLVVGHDDHGHPVNLTSWWFWRH